MVKITVFNELVFNELVFNELVAPCPYPLIKSYVKPRAT